SCGLALHRAAKRPVESVLLMSTDPAHSLADVLQIKLGATPRKLPGIRGRVSTWQVDSNREFQKFLSGNRDAILNIVESGTFFSREEIAPLLDTTLPGMAEVAALLAIQELLEKGKYDHIIVDTAPFGHTLRLFELPSHFQLFLNFLTVAASRDELLARRFGGRVSRPASAFLERWQAAVDQVKESFSSRNAEILLVTTPESFSLKQAARSMDALKNSAPEMALEAIVLNRAVENPGECPQCRRSARATATALGWLKHRFPGKRVLMGPDPGNPVLGLQLLRRFGDRVFSGRPAKLHAKAPATEKISVGKTDWPEAKTPLSFTVGKGGVGKTTTTAALAFRTRTIQKGARVMVCSTDPAPSLDDVFQQEIGDRPSAVWGDRLMSAMEMDSASEFRRWASGIRQKLDSELSMQSGGLHVDLTFEKEVFAALMDVVPPGVDEVFAIFRIMDLLESGSGKILIDMAPTGHALELLRMPERILLWSRLLLKSLAAHRTLALARDVAVELASLGQRVRRLVAIMKDPGQSRVSAVMLAEPVPDRQTRRLLTAVEEIGARVDALFVNRVHLEANSGCKRCARRQGWQSVTLRSLRKRYPGHPTYLVREFPGEIAGAAALKRFTGQLWQIVK
ncbi:MAG TPA: ArsA family ATPase, partial [Candidatus Limnocylindrales bacterium]|nr:ArsA family ATPase [Candidatus Limnocylindrales bacterium]